MSYFGNTKSLKFILGYLPVQTLPYLERPSFITLQSNAKNHLN